MDDEQKEVDDSGVEKKVEQLDAMMNTPSAKEFGWVALEVQVLKRKFQLLDPSKFDYDEGERGMVSDEPDPQAKNIREQIDLLIQEKRRRLVEMELDATIGRINDLKLAKCQYLQDAISEIPAKDIYQVVQQLHVKNPLASSHNS